MQLITNIIKYYTKISVLSFVFILSPTVKVLIRPVYLFLPQILSFQDFLKVFPSPTVLNLTQKIQRNSEVLLGSGEFFFYHRDDG